jgi:hypothetical protein
MEIQDDGDPLPAISAPWQDVGRHAGESPRDHDQRVFTAWMLHNLSESELPMYATAPDGF